MNKSAEEFAGQSEGEEMESTEEGTEKTAPTDDGQELNTEENANVAEEVSTEQEVELDSLDVMTTERDELQQKWLRVVAELDNVRKRGAREMVQSRKFAQAEVLRSILEIQDNLERALQTAAGEANDGDDPNNLREGVELIYQKTAGLLKDKGVEPMEVLEKPFDPNFHEAVGQLPREGVTAGIVIEVVQQGYQFGDMVLRAARVIVST